MIPAYKWVAENWEAGRGPRGEGPRFHPKETDRTCHTGESARLQLVQEFKTTNEHMEMCQQLSLAPCAHSIPKYIFLV